MYVCVKMFIQYEVVMSAMSASITGPTPGQNASPVLCVNVLSLHTRKTK